MENFTSRADGEEKQVALFALIDTQLALSLGKHKYCRIASIKAEANVLRLVCCKCKFRLCSTSARRMQNANNASMQLKLLHCVICFHTQRSRASMHQVSSLNWVRDKLHRNEFNKTEVDREWKKYKKVRNFGTTRGRSCDFDHMMACSVQECDCTLEYFTPWKWLVLWIKSSPCCVGNKMLPRLSNITVNIYDPMNLFIGPHQFSMQQIQSFFMNKMYDFFISLLRRLEEIIKMKLGMVCQKKIHKHASWYIYIHKIYFILQKNLIHLDEISCWILITR